MNKQVFESLTTNELATLLTLSRESLECKDYESLKGLVSGLGDLLPLDHAICARANVENLMAPTPAAPDFDLLDVSYPAGYLDHYLKHQFYQSDATFLDWSTHLSPVNWGAIPAKCDFSYTEAVDAVAFGMHAGWTHGTLDTDTMNCFMFYLAMHESAKADDRTHTILTAAVPFLAAAFRRAIKTPQKAAPKLTPREIEVLKWVKEGKSSWDISRILKCTKRTVDFHIQNCKRKLDSVTRAQTVAKGLEYKIIEF